jgi:di/tricarboxylate transporter
MKRLLEVFTGDKGEISSKRVIGVIGALILFTSLIVSTRIELHPSKELVEAVEWVTILTLGFTSIDKFSGKPKNDE